MQDITSKIAINIKIKIEQQCNVQIGVRWTK